MDLVSFKDPDGFVFKFNEKIYRCIYQNSSNNYLDIFEKDFFIHLIKEKKIISFKEVENNFFDKLDKIEKNDKILNIDKIDYFSSPYEWPFDQLKDAAIFHLDLEIFLLKNDHCLKDASSKNIIFKNNKPLFIDLLSFKEYKKGDFWLGQIQFYQEFLNPLLLKSKLGIDYNYWYESNFYGIYSEDLNKILKYYQKFFPSIFFHVVLPSVTRNLFKNKGKKINSSSNFSKEKYIYILSSLKKIIKNLKISKKKKSRWSSYNDFLPYKVEEFEKKKDFIKKFLDENYFKNIVDLGCNDGTFLFLSSQKSNLIGYDFDHECINNSYIKSKGKKENCIFFVKNLAKEIIQQKKIQIKNIDVCLSLALIHHLRVTENIPINKIISYILSVADEGLIEFVSKNDEKFVEILGLKKDTYEDYTLDNIVNLLKKNSYDIKKIYEIKNDKRFLIHYKKINKAEFIE